MMTIKSSPVKIGAAHNDLIYVVDSDNKAETNYKYWCDVYINAVRIARLKNNPNPNFSNYGIFNVSKVIQSYVNSDYFTAAPTVAYIKPYTKYTIKFSERYEAAGTETTNDDVITDTEKFAYNTSYSYIESAIFNTGAIANNNLLHRQFITNRPDQISVPALNDFFITGYTTFPDVIATFSLRITVYTGLNQTGTATVSTHPSAINKDNDFIVNVGTKGLTNAGVSLTGKESYRIEILTDGAVTDTLNFNIDICEPKHELQHFVFLNRLGGFESVYFTKASRKTIEADRKVMMAQGSKYNATTFKVDTRDSNNVYYEAFKTFGSKYTEKLKVNSDWLTDQQYVWLTELLISPVIYLQQTIPASIGITSQTVYIPCRLATNDFEVRKKVNKKLSQLELEFNVGFNNYSQIR